MALVSTTQVAAILNVHRATLWLHRQNGRFTIEPVLKVGNHSLWDEAQVRAEAAKKMESTS